MGLLSHDDILKLHAAVVTARLVGSRSVLLAGIDPHFVARLPQATSPSDQVLQDLHSMNATPTLPDGSVPLAIWLANAIALSGAQNEAEIFKTALERCMIPQAVHQGPAAPAGAAAPAPGPGGAQPERAPPASPPAWIVPAGFVMGVGGCVGLLFIATVIPEPTRFQYDIFRTLLALAGAAFSMALTGLLVAHLPFGGGGYIAGGGTLAVFVALYFFSPAVLPPPPEKPLPLQPSATFAPTAPTAVGSLPPSVVETRTATVRPPARPRASPATSTASAAVGNGSGIEPVPASRCVSGTTAMEFREADSARCGSPTASAYREQGKLRWTLELGDGDGGKSLRSCFCTPTVP